ncbi:MAG: MFS transporter [gamma proteobacterium symbiont of Bathyaustriella thionipta]|nr:MFS transporter [gamma proteobacterium symbiont of Bathyaustriella thionipta]MCU7950153.1 MFS transporter [gamma proteobacterium symbiont of Bathyaustriella thionipta]MCU7952738.1 MFS transporter [gamma proteobacterium symbiont of Bathyaustriella thionipta]MCU7957343.1 MFS transporter [gamma proteobacterium symbiont of Bathyaustriella thionipta]MCU7968977.1 MFS transporter [gamma proteobacterium symbiont of Bathyaustriella thionipta]
MPYWRLSSFYWFYFASLGAFIPYWGLYLSDSGYSAIEIGQLMAVIMGTKIIAPYLWGWIADHRGNRLFIIRLGAVIAAIAYAGIFIINTFWWIFFVLLVFSFFWNAILPQFEALTFNHLDKNDHQYSWIRGWGSIGFIITVVSVGILLNTIDIANLPIIVLLLLSGIAVSTLMIFDHAGSPHEDVHLPIWNILKNKQVIALLLACLFVQASHGPYYTFYTIYAESHGYSHSWIGILWAVGVLSEVVAFAMMPWLVKRFGLRMLLLASLFSGSLRWLLIGFYIDNVYITAFAQTFHASTFGIYHAVAIAYIHRYFKGKNHGKGQALYSSVSFGLGGAIGSLYGGYLWESLGAGWTFSIAAMLSFIAFSISWKFTQNN